MSLRELTGVPLAEYIKIAASQNLYNSHEHEFQYLLKGETRKKANFKYNDPKIENLLNSAKDYYNQNSSSSVSIKRLTPFPDYFEVVLASRYPLEGPSRSLALFAKYAIGYDPFSNMVSGTSIFRYEDTTSKIRETIMDQFVQHQKTMTDSQFLTFFINCMTDSGVNCTQEQRNFIEKQKRELYIFMENPYSYSK